jgi:hypothetical protein
MSDWKIIPCKGKTGIMVIMTLMLSFTTEITSGRIARRLGHYYSFQQPDTTLKQQDSLLLMKDSATIKKELKRKLKDQEKALRDSLKWARDSIRWAKPRYLNTYILEDSLKYKRIIMWNFNQDLNSIELQKPDTAFNENFYDYKFLKKDVGATYLGVSGSATLLHNYFLREKLYEFNDFSPYLIWGYTPETLPNYNTKTPHTEMAYWGTMFANRDKEETNIKFLHTQNFTPNFNFGVNYERFGASGLLGEEKTDNRNFSIAVNYLGERYVMQAGYISQSIKRAENGGIIDDKIILDTLIDVKTVSFRLLDADNHLRRNTFFITHSYGIPIKFHRRDKVADSTQNSSQEKDSLSVADGTITYFGHSAEYSAYSRTYSDNIDPADTAGVNLYHGWFNINPQTSFDSTRVSRLENKLFIRLQPWAHDAIISKMDGGIGLQLLNVYCFKPDFYLKPSNNAKYTNFYVYAGASGQFRKYFKWKGFARYTLEGYNAGDLSLDATIRLSAYPFNQPVHLTGQLKLSVTTPDWFQQSYYSNHYKWENNFGKVTETKIEARLEIPGIEMSAFAGYSLLNNQLFYGLDGVIAQHNHTESIFAASLEKNFILWQLHFDNRILYQYTTNREILPLPALSANLRYYLEFDVVKKVMKAQLGASMTYNTEYYAPSYSPALGQFHLQSDRKIGNYPYLDAFVNIQWKRTSIFIKYINAAQGWPDGDYFSANHYIMPQKAVKIGIHWPFYVK